VDAVANDLLSPAQDLDLSELTTGRQLAWCTRCSPIEQCYAGRTVPTAGNWVRREVLPGDLQNGANELGIIHINVNAAKASQQDAGIHRIRRDAQEGVFPVAVLPIVRQGPLRQRADSNERVAVLNPALPEFADVVG
jgi:hypothetical protein